MSANISKLKTDKAENNNSNTPTHDNSSQTKTNTNLSESTQSAPYTYNEHYQALLQRSQTEQFEEESKLGFIYTSGVDSAFRPVVVVVSANFPSSKNINLDRLLAYVVSVMHPIVHNEYAILYIQSNSTRNNSVSFSWLLKAYKILTRSYKKNLKALYILHPTLSVRAVLKLFKPFISQKFWQKVIYLHEVNDVYKYIHRDQIKLPNIAFQTKSKEQTKVVFGVSIEEVISRPDHVSLGLEIPIVVHQTTRYLLDHKAASIEGIFRLSGNLQQVQNMKKQYDKGEEVALDGVMEVASLLKLYFRELPDPVIPFSMYDAIIQAHKSEDSLGNICGVLLQLPEANKNVLCTLLELLTYIESHSHVNQMSSSNLAIVFAPNLIRCPNESMEQALTHSPLINSILRTIITNSTMVIPLLRPSIDNATL